MAAVPDVQLLHPVAAVAQRMAMMMVVLVPIMTPMPMMMGSSRSTSLMLPQQPPQ